LAKEFAALAGAVGAAGEGKDLGVVDEPVDHAGDVVGERFTWWCIRISLVCLPDR
jgi:hypothetical protein